MSDHATTIVADLVHANSPSGEDVVVGDAKTLKEWCEDMENAYPWYRPSKIAPKDSVLVAIAMILIDLANEAKESSVRERSGEPNEHLTITLDHVEITEMDEKTTARIIAVEDMSGRSTTTAWEHDRGQLLALAKHLLTGRYLGKHIPKDLKTYIEEVDMNVTSLDVDSFIEEMLVLVNRERSKVRYTWHVCTAVANKATKPALNLVRIAAGAAGNGVKMLCNIQ
ncbi:hypothetical protein B0O80DRAFT_527010 [Mortierella sp. GBAus27b]|nr:hypothetical protein B0O80DRAFT_527010 [Mortierella sp. GBAus27b]